MASWSGDLEAQSSGTRHPRLRSDPERAPTGTLLVEVAWEVCNQLGGIYQVIKSKAPRMVGRWKNRYYMLGPWNPAKAALEFEERAPRPNSWVATCLDQLRSGGLIVHHGNWLIPGRPKVLLVEHALPPHDLDALKYRIWTDHGIEFPPSEWLIDGVVSFAEAAKRILWSMSLNWAAANAHEHDHDDDHAPAPEHRAHRRTLAHFHEWMGGLAIPLLRKEQAPVATVFTTHATQLGRTLAWGDEYFYDHLPFVEGPIADSEARRTNIATQHQTEKACAHAAHVFTTVSGITGEECTHLLGRTPDIVTPNGLNIEHYNVGHDFQTYHAQFKERIHRFTMGHFFPSYAFDLDKTIYMFTSGRFEPRNKGFDLCIEAMARLNAELKASRLDRTVVFFIVTNRNPRSLHPRALHSRGVLDQLHDVCDKVIEEIREPWFRSLAAASGGGGRVGDGAALTPPSKLDELVTEYWRLRLRRTQHAFRTDHLPMIVTHLLDDDSKDDVLNQIRNVWLFNRAEDPVKIVYHPEFISPTNPLWGIEYDQFVRGCHMGVFPSAYEPWGYTPLECLAMGVPAVTSDLAGFGRFVEDAHPELATGFTTPPTSPGPTSGVHHPTTLQVSPSGGLSVLKRRGRTFSEAAADLSRQLLAFCQMDRRQRIQLRNDVERCSWDFDWSVLGAAYDHAHDLALIRAGVSA
ncbi:MAG TPA: glycosyltransferase [Phycisphaerales bacterium]|nr:glycosyltransferase [Phycisphaerales bacterium]